MSLSPSPKVFARSVIALGLAVTLSACATSQDVATRNDGFNDPYEAQNRGIHAFNKGLDKDVLRPVAKGYGVVPVEVRDTVNNFSDNLNEPAHMVNSLLQGDLADAGISLVRFVMNTTIGIGGLVDAASELGIEERDTDFGETLAVWGVGEGAYVELPVFGPSTQRDAVGFVVDFFTNPLGLNNLDDPEKYVPPTALGAATLNNREKFSDSIDSVLYDSADSYAQSRQIYLQNRRFELGQDAGVNIDPYEDPYAQ